MTPEEFGVHLDAYFRKHRRLWDRRFFRGTVTSVSSGGVPPCTVTVVELGSDTTAVHTGISAIPGYTPAVGDDVECVWRDEATCYILWPL